MVDYALSLSLSHTLYLSPYLALSLSLSEIYAQPPLYPTPLDGDHLTSARW